MKGSLISNNEHEKKGGKRLKKRKFEQEGVDDFFKESANSAKAFLEDALKKAKTADEKKRIRKLLEDFKGGKN